MTHVVKVDKSRYPSVGGWYGMCQNCSWGTWNPMLWVVRLKAWWHGRRQ